MKHAALFLSWSVVSVVASAAAAEPGLELGHDQQIQIPVRVPAEPPAPAQSSPHLTYRGGSLLGAVQIHAVFWGPAVRFTHELGQFYADVTNSRYFDWLSEYNTSSGAIGRGSMSNGLYWLNAPVASVISDVTIQEQLAGLIHGGYLPPGDGRTLIMVHFPPGVTVTLDASKSCETFCAYHGGFVLDGAPVYYGVVPDHGGACAWGCGGGTTTELNKTTVSASHEVIEAVTDPVPGSGWYDDAQGEIGDICNGQPAQVGKWFVQRQWSNARNACVALP